MGNLILTLIAFTLYKTNFGSIVKSEFILQFRIKTGNNQTSEDYIKILSKHTKSHTLLSSESSADNKSIKVTVQTC